MIDYISLNISHLHNPIPSGRVIKIKPDGTIQFDVPIAISVQGSFESTITVRSMGALSENGQCEELFISGNPAKFLQGHNIFGHEDPIQMMTEVLKRVTSSLGMNSVSEYALATAIVSRLDFTRSLQFENIEQVRAYIRQMSIRARTRNGRPNLKGYTLTFQQTSKRWSLVIYSKGDEIKAHPLPETLQQTEIYNESKRLARIELRLLTLELTKLGIRKLHQCKPELLKQIYLDYVGKIEMNTKTELPSEELLSLKRCFRDTYMMWREGIDIASTMKVPTLYRHRHELMRYGIDIFIARDIHATSEIIPLKRVISGQLYETPSWAYQKGLIFQPTTLAA